MIIVGETFVVYILGLYVQRVPHDILDQKNSRALLWGLWLTPKIIFEVTGEISTLTFFLPVPFFFIFEKIPKIKNKK